MCNKILEVTIDDIHFLSFPCQNSSDEHTHRSTGSEDGLLSHASFDLSSGQDNATSTNNNIGHKDSSGTQVVMFNIVVAMVSIKGIKNFFPEFVHKCQAKYSCAPGVDPIAAALGIRNDFYGICRQVLKR